ncbi:MAG: hypothetical protein K0Q43_715 [Ramlibacter sp.]|nr:hypothetical protein [Ramlibacter sp.]
MTVYYFPHVKVHKRSWKRDEQLYRLRIKEKVRRVATLADQQKVSAPTAYSLKSLGDRIFLWPAVPRDANGRVAGPARPRTLHSITVAMSSWACETGVSGAVGNCASTANSAFDHPITLNIYDDSGALLAARDLPPTGVPRQSPRSRSMTLRLGSASTTTREGRPADAPQAISDDPCGQLHALQASPDSPAGAGRLVPAVQ